MDIVAESDLEDLKSEASIPISSYMLPYESLSNFCHPFHAIEMTMNLLDELL